MAQRKRPAKKRPVKGEKPTKASSASSKAKKVPVSGGNGPASASKGRAKKPSAGRPVTKSGSSRKPNRYNILRKAISDYCKRKYGRVCNNAEINEMYRELKTRFFDVDPKKQVSPAELARTIDEKLGFRTSAQVPEELQIVNWYDIESSFRQQDGLFFQPTDKITIDTAQIVGTLTFEYQQLSTVYRDSLYTKIRQAMDDYERQFGAKPSPPWTFQYADDESNPQRRQFTWKIQTDEGQAAIQPTQPAQPSAPTSAASDELKLTEEKRRLVEAEKARYEAKLKLIQEGRALLADKLITKAEFKRYFLDA